MSDRPLLTFLLITYNQARYVRQAVEGAFSQTYQPLEIILSDDCSPDRTFQIMQELAAAYRGPHTVILNHNDSNLGLGAHINKAMSLARGELIVVAAGDDISLPERTERIYKVYEESGGRAMSIYSGMRIIDECGQQGGWFGYPPDRAINDLRARLKNVCVGVAGCSHAWHRSIFDVFGNMLDETNAEDLVLPLRSALLGTVCYFEAPMVLYRRHAGNACGRRPVDVPRAQLFQDVVRRRTRTLITLRNHLKDLSIEHPDIRIDAELRSRLRRRITREIMTVELDIASFNGSFADRVFIICQGLRRGLPPLQIGEWLLRLVLPGLYAWMIRPKHENAFHHLMPPSNASGKLDMLGGEQVV